MNWGVAVTGIGVVCSAGAGKEPFWAAVSGPAPQVRPIRRFDPAGFRCRIAAEIPDLPGARPSRVSPVLWDLTARSGLVASREALAESGADLQEGTTGLYWGSAVGGIISLDEQFSNFYTRGPRWVVPATVPRTMLSAAAGLIAIETGIRGPNCTFSSACSASSHAIAMAFEQIQNGALRRCLVGGADCPIAPGHVRAWDQLRALSPDNETPQRACRPFSRNRRGLVLGEAAVAFMLEREEDAEARGAGVYGRIRAQAANCDAEGILQPAAASLTECIRLALDRAGWGGRVPDYIAAHGTGTRDGDRAEVAALHSCFEGRAAEVVLSSIKSTLGHTLGASGALSLAATLLAMQAGVIPPTANHEEADPECEIDCVPNVARKGRIRRALIHSFAFGGSNVVLAVEGP